jgi:hypothetical protein
VFEDPSSIVGPGVVTITLIRQKILYSVVDVVSKALSMHVLASAIWTVVVPA